MLRIAVQAKGRLFDETMSFLEESDIKLSATKRTLLVQSSNFPLEVLQHGRTLYGGYMYLFYFPAGKGGKGNVFSSL